MRRAVLTIAIGVSLVASHIACGGDDETPACIPGANSGYLTEPFAKLSDYCMVSIDGGRVTPSSGVTPYDINDALFSDYAQKFRTVWVPPGKKASYVEGKPFDLPVGSVLTKSFGFSPDTTKPEGVRWLETRVLIREEAGWRGVSYVWDDAQKEATILPGGKVTEIDFSHPTGPKKAQYLIPNQNQCKKCHADGEAIALIGIRADQLNRPFRYADGEENQLAHWQKAGFLEGVPAAPPALAHWDDTSLPVDTRARAYLASNCSYCHNETGEARTSGLFLGSSVTDNYRLGFCKTPVAAGRAAAHMKYAVVPGKPDESILLYRMKSTEPSIAMPEIGRSLVHEEAATLIRDWITSLPGGCAP